VAHLRDGREALVELRRCAVAQLIERSPLVAQGLLDGGQHLTGLSKLQVFMKAEPQADVEDVLR
jgi:hypothetical protein